ncbi:MAG: SMC-Scp complex subunit ScpB [Chitinivibrionales bacterium]|nr:SMC-Scp complex subunit ScpB [Chitinivibrionales bacterium]
MADEKERNVGEELEVNESLPEEAVESSDERREQPPERNSEDMSVLEAAIFASNEVLTAQRLKKILPGEPDARAIRRMVRTINDKLQRERHPFEIVEISGGFQFRTVPYYHRWVQQLFKEKAARRLSIQALECLAIVAYMQPLTKAEIEAIRGVASDGALKTLLEKHLVTIVGRSDKAGHPLLYGSTSTFLQYFGLNKLSDLPKIEEFEAMAREKMDDLSDEELQRIEELASEEGEGGEEAAEDTESGTGEGGEAQDEPAEAGNGPEEYSSEEEMADRDAVEGDDTRFDEDDEREKLVEEGAAGEVPEAEDAEELPSDRQPEIGSVMDDRAKQFESGSDSSDIDAEGDIAEIESTEEESPEEGEKPE